MEFLQSIKRWYEANKPPRLPMLRGGIPLDIRELLRTAEQLELHALVIENPRSRYATSECLDECSRGKTTLRGEGARQLMDAFDQSILSAGREYRAFVPQHALRATKDNQTAIVVISFSGNMAFAAMNEQRENVFLPGASAEAIFNAALRQAGIATE